MAMWAAIIYGRNPTLLLTPSGFGCLRTPDYSKVALERCRGLSVTDLCIPPMSVLTSVHAGIFVHFLDANYDIGRIGNGLAGQTTEMLQGNL